MSSTRDFKNPGIFAENASTVIPPTPIAGVAYRDQVGGADDTPNGWRYGTRVESQDWNQIMFLMTSMMGMMDTQGILGWSSDVDYTGPCITFGSDGELYLKTALASGPNNGGPQDPVSSPSYWQAFSSMFGASPGDVKTIAYSTPPAGWLKCNGAAISRTTYADLFAAIGTTYGSGDGSTTFNVPETRGEFVRGWDDGRGVDPGRVFGQPQKGSLTAFDPTSAVNAVAGLHSTGPDATTREDIGLDPAAGGLYPTIDVVTVSASSSSPISTAGGVSRPRNIAFMYVIKT